MYKQGDIVAVHYPFSDDITKSKLRPAIVISNEMSNQLDNDLIISPITTTLRKTVFSFSLTNNDVINPLPKNSEVRCNKFTTIRESLVLGKISELKKDKLSELLIQVKSVF